MISVFAFCLFASHFSFASSFEGYGRNAKPNSPSSHPVIRWAPFPGDRIPSGCDGIHSKKKTKTKHNTEATIRILQQAEGNTEGHCNDCGHRKKESHRRCQTVWIQPCVKWTLCVKTAEKPRVRKYVCPYKCQILSCVRVRLSARVVHVTFRPCGSGCRLFLEAASLVRGGGLTSLRNVTAGSEEEKAKEGAQRQRCVHSCLWSTSCEPARSQQGQDSLAGRYIPQP